MATLNRALKGLRPFRASSSLFPGVFCILLVSLAQCATARITRVTITSVQSPTFDGTSFGTVGQYEKLVGRAFGEVDPNDPRNAVITDIGLAPLNANGMVEYSMDIYLLVPVDRSKGNGKLFYEVNNRGSKLALSGTFGSINSGSSGGNDPTTAADAGDGFLMREGYAIAWSGWDVTVPSVNNLLSIAVPVATNPDGSSIVGPALEEFAIDNSTTMTAALTYAAATLDQSQANLTVRNHYSDAPALIPASGWQYVDAKTIRLLPAGTPFQLGTLYEFTYQAKDPPIAGLGFAATRDFASFLHYTAADDDGTPNPLAGAVQLVYTFSVSQPTRFLHDFLYLGFNQDEQGRQVVDAMENYTGGGNGGFFNYRFAQPGRTHRQHINRWYPKLHFPFTNQVLTDSVTGQTDGRLVPCRATATCPRIFEINTENEYWAKAGSLLHTDSAGNDLDLHGAPETRVYLLSSITHVPATGAGICQQPRNPVVPDPALRALLVALDEWVSWDIRPPASRVPRRSDGTLVPPLPQESVGFPHIPGIKYVGLLHTGDLLDFGPSANQGILTILPATVHSAVFAALVPRTDPDGNDIAGIRLPEIAAPLATYTGWGLRAGPAADDGCDAYGQMIPLAQTQTARLANGDPRLSIEERYQTHEGYASAVGKAVADLLRERLLLVEDAERYSALAEASQVLR
ncbi:MAG TPA: alpha/beta hydrolase domain-containing protein [Bryobacteraceae bacterium]|nr:alpha/beta hydrolase domain-containing protein [Bryobacteraceae bacterium]